MSTFVYNEYLLLNFHLNRSFNVDFFMVLQPNAETKDNVTPLLSAVAAGSMACLELLVKVWDVPNLSVVLFQLLYILDQAWFLFC